ncbi:MAG: hypothetical protein FWG71_04810 [Synergistaceae bacterium]|nr:hypothetical protein [Synergistaceae bacterium]
MDTCEEGQASFRITVKLFFQPYPAPPFYEITTPPATEIENSEQASGTLKHEQTHVIIDGSYRMNRLRGAGFRFLFQSNRTHSATLAAPKVAVGSPRGIALSADSVVADKSSA